jgi:hypothetical protein
MLVYVLLHLLPEDTVKLQCPRDLEEFDRLKKCEGLVRWYLKYHEATGCQIDGCVDGGFPIMGPCGYMEAEACEYCAMIFEAKKVIKAIDNALPPVVHSTKQIGRSL